MNVVTADELSCVNHGIPDITGRYAPAVQVLGNWLFICGGHLRNADEPLKNCYKLDLDSVSPAWQSFTSLPSKRRDFALLRYGDYM